MTDTTEFRLLEILNVAIEKAGSLRAFARNHKISAAYVSDVRLGKRGAGPSIAKALGYRVKTRRTLARTYQRSTR